MKGNLRLLRRLFTKNDFALRKLQPWFPYSSLAGKVATRVSDQIYGHNPEPVVIGATLTCNRAIHSHKLRVVGVKLILNRYLQGWVVGRAVARLYSEQVGRELWVIGSGDYLAAELIGLSIAYELYGESGVTGYLYQVPTWGNDVSSSPIEARGFLFVIALMRMLPLKTCDVQITQLGVIEGSLRDFTVTVKEYEREVRRLCPKLCALLSEL